jgi:putative ABC transport system permease protein
MSRLPALALRNVARNRRRSRITLGAILIGVAASVMLRGMNGGFVDFMVRDVVETRIGALQVHRAGYQDDYEGMPLALNMPADPAFVEKIRTVPGVTAVAGRIQFAGLVTNGLSQTMFVGRGIDVEAERQVCPRSGKDIVAGGAPLGPGDRSAAVLGNELAQSFNAVPAGTVNAASAVPAFHTVTLSSASPEGRANSLSFAVRGLSRSAMLFENKRVLTVSLADAQALLGLEGRVTEYAVAADDLSNLEAIAARVRTALGPEYEVHTWRQLQPFYSDVIRIQRFLIGLISFVLYAIVLTGIANTMLMSVYERVREIGTLLAVGLRRRQVLTLFLIEAAVLGVVGALIGAVVGRGLVGLLAWKGIHLQVGGGAIDTLLRPQVEPLYIAIVAVIAVIGAVIAAAYPAFKASRMNPVDALRAT